MSTIHVTINGQAIGAEEGQTLLDVCRANEINVPTLCHHEGLPDIGACRLCIVEVEGQRRPVPSCTTPAQEGMVVQTQTPQLEDLRRQTLELLFAERNHICPFCPMSGNCELQRNAYQHGMDHVRFDYCFPTLPMDNSHARIALDHNRCILCTRCVRSCDQWVGAHVLDVDNRGSRAMLIADNALALGESSCVSCGTCLQVCPTGALFEKRSAHWQGRLPLEMTETICPNCGVGCRINVSVRHRQIGELRSAGGPNGNNILCVHGRFGLVEPKAPRVKEIRVKQAGKWATKSIDDLLKEIARRLNAKPIQDDPSRVVMLMTPNLPLETLSACQNFLTNVVGSERWSVIDRTRAWFVREALGLSDKMPPLAGLTDLDESDMFLCIGTNLEASHGVLASYVRRGILHRKAKLVKINPMRTWLSDWSDVEVNIDRGKDLIVLAAIFKYVLEAEKTDVDIPDALVKQLKKCDDSDIQSLTGVPAEGLKRIAEMYVQAEKPMILCGRGVTRQSPQVLRSAMNFVYATNRKTDSGRWRLMELASGANSAGGRLLGHTTTALNDIDPHTVDVAFVVMGDDHHEWPREWLETLRTVSYVVVLQARDHEAAEAAHVVIPTAAWSERGGTFVNLEGRVQKSQALMSLPAGCVDEADFFTRLAKAWRGEDCGWAPPGLPPALQHIGDKHMVPCDELPANMDWAGLQALVED